MKKKIIITISLIILISLFYSISVFAGGQLKVNVNSKYTIGGPVMIKITSSEAIKDPSNVKVEILKPDGSKVESVARQEGWNGSNECFDIYTIDYQGIYKVNVTDSSSGATGSATFSSLLFTLGSTVVMLISIIILIASLIFWRVKGNKTA